MLFLHYSIILLALKVGWAWHLPLPAPSTENLHLNESSVICCRAHFVLEPEEEGPLLQAHVFKHDTIVLVIPVVAGFEEALHDLSAGMRPCVCAPRRDLSSIHAQLEVVPLRMGRGRFGDAVPNPEACSYELMSSSSRITSKSAWLLTWDRWNVDRDD
jgi:hypothetical protein